MPSAVLPMLRGGDGGSDGGREWGLRGAGVCALAYSFPCLLPTGSKMVPRGAALSAKKTHVPRHTPLTPPCDFPVTTP